MKDEELYEEIDDFDKEVEEDYQEEPDPDWEYFDRNKEHFVYGLD